MEKLRLDNESLKAIKDLTKAVNRLADSKSSDRSVGDVTDSPGYTIDGVLTEEGIDIFWEPKAEITGNKRGPRGFDNWV